jgi:hypothetical protein
MTNYNMYDNGAMDYLELEECIESGHHLEACDDDGFCNSCGCQAEEDDFRDEYFGDE